MSQCIFSSAITQEGISDDLFFLLVTFQLHDMIKDSVGNKVKNEYERGGDDVFSFSIDILHYLVGSLLGFLMFADISWPLVFCLLVVVVLFCFGFLLLSLLLLFWLFFGVCGLLLLVWWWWWW